MSESRPSLAQTLTKLRLDERLSYAHIARVGRISRNTAKQIADGKTHQPDAETLAKIAVGIGVDPSYGHMVQDTLDRALRELGEAAGYGDLRDPLMTRTLPVLLAAVVGDLDDAVAWLVRMAAESPKAAEHTRALGRRLDAERGGGDGA